ncbi:MAG: TonB-dependent receptor, partial [Bacteroidota bacterium]
EARWQLANHVDVADDLNNLSNLYGTTASREVLWGALVNMSYLPSIDHQINFNYMHNQSGISTARYLEGAIPKDDINLVFQTRVAGYKQRSLDAFQLKGDHDFGLLKMDWTGAYTISSQDEPDLRFFSNDFTRDDTLFDIQPNLYTAPSRYFRRMDENNADLRVNFELPFQQWSDLQAKFKFGGAFTRKDRNFTEFRYEFENGTPGLLSYEGDEEAYWAEDNIGVIATDPNGLFLFGNYANNATERRNNYTGLQNVIAGYAMVELPLTRTLRFVGGTRMETTDILVQSRDQAIEAGELNNVDLLPSANLIYTINGDSVKNIMNIRGSYARTIARPTFRELAPYASFDFVGDFVLVGSANLERTLIDNFDLRWELFPTTRELISVGAFYKKFQNPIERVINPIAQNVELNYRNVPQAQLFGVEFEFRKNLGFISPLFDNFRASGNLSLIKSQLDINPQELSQIHALNPYAEPTREMFNQSPYTANAELAYIHDTLGITSAVNFSVFGPRISAVSLGGTPNVYEQPRPSLDFSVGKTFKNGLGIRIRARNLLNPEYRQIHTFKGEEFTYNSYRIGRTFSFGVSYTIQ